ncbi:MFS general substrate transporter [Annulohypoxylon truncatum]|uniref:MFS general substrate transporter n=1 Tax=Annulohypoxylon truncatum TaxID=327061 RepID=UPI0020089B0F|nr:MFS general substrate transporter [Annulohypoxylon truncatum]KAI1214337.1 MFS general substrate transporter [Annulohypoxylon truncatum]
MSSEVRDAEKAAGMPADLHQCNSRPAHNIDPALNRLPPLDTSPRGWLAVVGGFACLFVSFGWITCIGVFQAYYSTHQLRDYNASDVGWITSAETFLLFLGVPIFGGLFDRLGPTVILIIGTVLHVGGLLGVANCRTYGQFFAAQSIVSAMGTGAIFVAGTTAVGTWFKARRGLALGLVSAGSALGAVIGTAVIPVLFDHIGFSWTMRAVALTYFVLLVIAIATTSRRPQEAVSSPAPFRVSQFVPVSLLRSGPVLTLAIACFFYFLGVFIPYNFIVVEAQDAGDGQQSANNLLVILSATSTVGRVMPGWLGDRYGRFNTTIAFTFFSIVLVLCVWIAAPFKAGRIVFAALYGFGSGTFVSMVPTLIAQVCPDMSKLGLYLGAVYLVIAPSVLIAQPVAGLLADAGDRNGRDPYVWLKVFCALGMIVGIVGFIAARAAYQGHARKLWKSGRV